MATQNRGGKARASGQRRPSTPAPSSGAGGGSPRRLGQQVEDARANAPRRLGQQPQRPRSAPPAGAKRRGRNTGRRSGALYGWLSVAVVLVVVLVFALVKVTGGGGGTTSNDAAGRHPAAASASILNDLLATPLSVQNAAGLGTQTASPYLTVAGTHPLTQSGLPRIAFVGAEFCPFCAVERYSLILALSRLGTFHGLKVVNSANTDGDIPTFSFLGSSYTSKYVAFTPYEDEDRNHSSLAPPPAKIQSLWVNQDTAATNSVGYPYVNFGGKYVLANFPTGLDQSLSFLEGSNGSGSGLTRSQIVAGIRSPSSSYGQLIDGSALLSEANYIDAAVCLLDGGKPSSVCQASAIKAAMAVLSATKVTKLPA